MSETSTHAHRNLAPDMFASSQRPPRVATRTVVEVVFLRGEGCCSEDRVREVTAYYDPDGKLLAETDPARSLEVDGDE